jgi:hypothetical protein
VAVGFGEEIQTTEEAMGGASADELVPTPEEEEEGKKLAAKLPQ